MTDEEKNAIEFLKGVCTDDCASRPYIVEPILNLIETQQKEIEELKKDKLELINKHHVVHLKDVEKEKEKNKDMSCDLTETRADNIDESTMLKQIKLKLQEKNIPIETLLAEFERLEDLEELKEKAKKCEYYEMVADELSKEIEELKKPKYIMNFETNEITTLTNDFISKAKIKAILKKYGKKEIEYAPDFYKEIQSLLEEE